MPIGAGLAPAGASSAGYGVPDAAATPINAPLPDPRTGFAQTGRMINPQTKDYVFTADGRIQGVGTVPQLVLLALTTELGSSAVPTLGHSLKKIQEKGSNYVQQVTAVVNAALADLVKKKLVQVVSVDVQDYASRPDTGVVKLQWRDLTTGAVTVQNLGP